MTGQCHRHVFVAAGRSRHRSLTLLGAACLTVGVFMLGHGLATPGVADRPMNAWVSRFPVIALAGFATLLALALRRPTDRLGFVGRHPRAFLSVYASVITVAVTAAVLWPTAGPGHAMVHGESELGDVVLLLSGLTLLATGWGYHRRWRLGRDRVQLALGSPVGSASRRWYRCGSAACGTCPRGSTTPSCSPASAAPSLLSSRSTGGFN